MRQVIVGEQIAVADVQPAPLGPHQVRIEVAYAGICGSELHPLLDRENYSGDVGTQYEWVPSGRDDPDGNASFGHEYSGLVSEVGAGVRSVAVGDRVVCMPRWPCSGCRQCRTGRLSYCERFGIPVRGAWADEIVVPERVVFELPREVSLKKGALCEPLACALRGLDRAVAPAGHVALVIGGGPIGLLTAALALRFGAREVVLSEPRAPRREIAARIGAIAVDPTELSLSEIADTHTDGLGFEVVYEAVGRSDTIAEAVEVAAHGGTIVVLGVAPPGAVAPIRPWRLFERELTLMAAFGPEVGFQRAMELLPTLDLEPIVTHVLELAEIERAIEIAAAGDGGKVLLAPGGPR